MIVLCAVWSALLWLCCVLCCDCAVRRVTLLTKLASCTKLNAQNQWIGQKNQPGDVNEQVGNRPIRSNPMNWAVAKKKSLGEAICRLLQSKKWGNGNNFSDPLKGQFRIRKKMGLAIACIILDILVQNLLYHPQTIRLNDLEQQGNWSIRSKMRSKVQCSVTLEMRKMKPLAKQQQLASYHTRLKIWWIMQNQSDWTLSRRQTSWNGKSFVIFSKQLVV